MSKEQSDIFVKNFKEETLPKMSNTMKIVNNFFLSLGKCFTIEALIQFFGLESQDNLPTKHTPPSNIREMEKEEIKKYSEDVLDEFINQFLLDMPADGDADDFVRNYSLCLLQYFFYIM